MSIGKKLRYLRKLSSMTIEDVGEKIGASRQTIFKYENEIVTNIPLDKIELLAKTYSVSPSYIAGWEDATESPDNLKHIELKEKELQKTIEDIKSLKKKYEFMNTLNKKEMKDVKKYVEFLKSKRKAEGKNDA